MKITREKACQRLHHRVSTPLTISIENRQYRAKDWSLGGLSIALEHSENWRPGDVLAANFKLPFQGFDIGFDVELEIVRTDSDSELIAAKFVALTDRQKELMNHFVDQLIRGAMVPVDDTILRIDSPVTPVSVDVEPSPVEEMAPKRWPLKMIGMSAAYILGGLTLFALVGTTIYENFVSVRVTSAITVKPVEPIVSLVDGRIIDVRVRVDDSVQEGADLFQILSPKVNHRLEDAKIDLERVKLELESLRKKHELSIEITGSHLSKEAKLFEIEIDKVQQEVTLATQSLVSVYEYKDNLLVSSPFDGKLVKLFRNRGSLVKSGEVLALFERDELPRVMAYLTKDEAKHLRLHDRAIVTSSILDAKWPGVISRIGPNDPQHSSLDFDADKSMSVELTLDLAEERLREVVSGIPVEVLFPATRIRVLKQLMESEKDLMAASTPVAVGRGPI